MRLENDAVRVQFDAKTGGFASVYDKRLNREYIGAPDRALLFRLVTPDGDVVAHHVDAAQPDVTIAHNEARLSYTLTGFSVEVAMVIEGASLIARLRVTNSSNINIEEVMFPWIRGLTPLEDAAFTWPHFWKRRFADPFGADLGGDHHTWNEWTQKQVGRYPAHLASAWCDYGNSTGGIALEGRHQDFSIMDFFVHKIVEKTFEPVRRSLDITTVLPRRVKPGETYETPPVRLYIHPGDWHAPADAHRRWLETWIAKPDRPAKFAEAIGWHFFFMKHQDGLERNTYADLPAMAEAALAAGCPYLLVFGWQTGGHDNNYMYRYTPNESWGGAEALRDAVQKVRARGAEIMPFFNGTLANTGLPEHRDFGHRWEVKSRTGLPLYAGDWARHNFDAITRNRAMLHHEIAPCREQRKYFLDTVQRIVQQYKFGNLQLDQISEKMFPDYNEDHIETTPDRVYVDGLKALLTQTRELVRAANPQGVMISECINEFTGQWCDSSWDWNILMDFPEPTLYTLPWLMASHEVDALEFGEANKAFVYKMHLDLKIDGGDAPITKYPRFAKYIKAHAELRRRAAEYYVYGDFRDQENVAVQTTEGVVVKVYHNRNANKVGIVAAEVAGRDGSAVIRSAWKPAPAVVIQRSSRRTDQEVPFTSECTVQLQPYEVCILCLDLPR